MDGMRQGQKQTDEVRNLEIQEMMMTWIRLTIVNMVKKKSYSGYCLRIKPIGFAETVGVMSGKKKLFIILLSRYFSKCDPKTLPHSLAKNMSKWIPSFYLRTTKSDC